MKWNKLKKKKVLGRTLAMSNKRSKSSQWNVMDKLTHTHRWCEAYKNKFGENVRGGELIQ